MTDQPPLFDLPPPEAPKPVPTVDELRLRGLWPFPPIWHYHGREAA